MKSIYILVIGAIYLLCSCSKEELLTYNNNTSERFIYFEKSEADSSEISFFTYPGETVINFPVIVKSSGFSNQDNEYKIIVMDEYTTAVPSDYEIPDKYVFKAGAIKDTCYIKLKYSSKLDSDKVRVVIKLASNENFTEGENTYQVAIIWFHNIISKPDWWTSTVTSYYLGTYSDLKYSLFNRIVGIDLTDADESTIRHYALVFKQYLEEQKAADNTILEVDGTEMTVVAGGKLK
ncbi:MAG TPA: DUF4843 domain-containing protein [Butyricimonas virosa]|uniref:DUF4843 domain-containing protein n=1 Tax=Butyricimonas virosa TaxID=544645 RepID=A0A921KYF3_9BACT|nr:DUF4843 domain-containing protein [Butyricimonas virosa]